MVKIGSKNYQEYQEWRTGTNDKIYFSGANVRVYFGDVWVEELASIQFSLDENVAPVYGFNSYMFDKVARGTRLVSGSFMINHTDAGYLDIILDTVYNKVDKENKQMLSEKGVDSLIKDVARSSSSKSIRNILNYKNKGQYEKYVEGLKDSFWGPREASENTIYSSGEKREYDTHYFKDKEGYNFKNTLKDHGFNILIDYSPSANERSFQECIRGINKEGSLGQSFRSIIGVHITGENQVISPDGNHIQNQYNFIARDLDGDVTQLSMKHNQLKNQYSFVDSEYGYNKDNTSGGSGGASSGGFEPEKL